jgi:hypothetical protein
MGKHYLELYQIRIVITIPTLVKRSRGVWNAVTSTYHAGTVDSYKATTDNTEVK